MNMLIITTSKILYKSTLFDLFVALGPYDFYDRVSMTWFFRRVCHRGFFLDASPHIIYYYICGATIGLTPAMTGCLYSSQV